MRILIKGEYFAADGNSQGNQTNIINKPGESWVVINKILELGIFIRDSIIYYQTQNLKGSTSTKFLFNEFLKNIMEFTDKTGEDLDLDKIIEDIKKMYDKLPLKL